MINGAYVCRYSGIAGAGQGVATIRSGDISGGDSGFAFRGTYTTNGASVTASVRVTPIVSGHNSVVGIPGPFQLTLTGQFHGTGFQLEGFVPGMPSARIVITGQLLP